MARLLLVSVGPRFKKLGSPKHVMEGERHTCQNQRLSVNVEIQDTWILQAQMLLALELRKLLIIYALDGARGIQRVT